MSLTSRPRRRVARLALAAALAALPARGESLFGRELWFAWPQTPDIRADDPQQDLDGQLVLLAESGSVSVTVTGPGVNTTVTASPGAPALVRIPRVPAMVVDSDVPVDAGIRAVSADCSRFGAYFRVPGSGSSVGDDIARLLPVPLLGRTVLPAAYWGSSEFVVVATQDGTQVSLADLVCPASPATFVLNRGQAVQHRCVEAPGNGDVSGTLVTASAPIAVISGSESSTIINHPGPRPGSRGYWGWADVLLESPWPLELLGREAAHAPFRRESPTASGDLVRVFAACAPQTIRASEDGATWADIVLNDVGAHVDLEQYDAVAMTFGLVRGGLRLESDLPFQAASYTVGSMNAGIGDPALSVLDPRERWERRAVVYLPEGYEHSLGIVAPASATASVRLDGAPVPGSWAPVGSATSGLRWLRLDLVPDGEHRLSCDEPFFVEASSYTENLAAGAAIAPAIPLGDGGESALLQAPSGCSTPCAGSCVRLVAPGGRASYSWTVDGTPAGSAPDLTTCPTAPSDVAVVMTDAAGCVTTARHRIEVRTGPAAPPIAGPTEACAGACVTLRAPDGFASYAWDTGATTQEVTVCPTAPTTYSCELEQAGGCASVVTHEVTTYPPPMPGAAAVATGGPCQRGLRVSWDAATWRPGSPGGTYSVYRREGTCANEDDPGWSLLASGLGALEHFDPTALQGVAYTYRVEAEDASAPGACRPGPDHGGPTASACALPESAADPGDPDEPRLISLSPWLRATGYERVAPAGACSNATFAWTLAPDVDPATHVEVWRSDRPDALRLLDRDVRARSWRDPDASGPRVLFYKVFNATDCGTLGLP